MSPEEAIQAIEEDIRQSLDEFIVADGATFEPDVAERTVSVDAERGTFALGWRYAGPLRTGEISGRGAPVGQPVELRGATILVAADEREGDEYHRYVDWADLFAQLPVGNGRPVVDPSTLG